MQTTKTINKLDVESIRKDFPILKRSVNGKPLVYLDNAATSQKPQQVIEAITDYYKTCNANIHRGVYTISAEASELYDDAKENVKNFINASDSREIIFTSGATEAINLVAHSYGRYNVKEGDEVIISAMEHHSNIVPWQVLCEEKKAKLRIIPINDSGELIIEEYKKLLNEKTKIVAVNHISNTLGTINPVKKIVEIAHERNIPVLIDGAQAVAHAKVDVRDLDADFYVFSGHKMFAPMGSGVLYGKAELLEAMPPYQTGGDMISSVSFEKTTYNEIPMKFEAGTPNVEGAIGLSSAIDYINSLDPEAVHEHEQALLVYATKQLENIDGIKIIGTAKNKASVISFIVEGLNVMDIGIMLDTMGIAVRTGHHCTEPLMNRFGIAGTVRASFSIYNTMEEVDVFITGFKKATGILR
jgi:cysteine desulfurase / selenocysteine lyase